jgi:hypothetical protein
MINHTLGELRGTNYRESENMGVINCLPLCLVILCC